MNSGFESGLLRHNFSHKIGSNWKIMGSSISLYTVLQVMAVWFLDTQSFAYQERDSENNYKNKYLIIIVINTAKEKFKMS